jgi:two-component system sensor histidine kinase CreC
MKPWSLTLRLFVVGAVLVAGFGWFALRQVLEEVKPAVRQSTEETLVDTANLLAELVADDLRAGRLAQSDLARVMAAYGQRDPEAEIWGIRKAGVTHRIYVTDANGTVVLDSTGRDLGKDYSRWNDVVRTLRGEYGARTTAEIPGDEGSTVMYVAAPVRDGDRIIGVVTVAKPNRSVQPFIERAQQRLGVLAATFIAAALLVGAGLSFWLSRAIRRLTVYADAVAAGGRPQVPSLPGRELAQLAQALDSMRAQLEGKAYVERYVQTLTHELKSPLAAIQGASELLGGELLPTQRARLLENIEVETARLQSMSERMLNLAQVEQRRTLEEQAYIPLQPLVAELFEGRAPQIARRGLRVSNDLPATAAVRGERFLVRQAFANLLDNALDFTPEGGLIRVDITPVAHPEMLGVSVFNQGEPIPDYALPRVTERFYSLARPGTGRKSTGLGLNFVQEVAQLHGGTFAIENAAEGVRVTLTLPLALA